MFIIMKDMVKKMIYINEKNRIILKMLISIFICIFIVLFFFYLINNNSKKAEIQNAVLNLSEYNFEKDQIINLNGQWEFFWNKQLKYNDFMSGYVDKGLIVQAPSAWNEYVYENNKLPSFGFGTYRLKVIGIEAGTKLSFRISDEATAYSLYIDDMLLMSNGVAGTSKSNTIPEIKSLKVDFESPSKEFNIILHISNFNRERGGMCAPIIFGNQNKIEKLDNTIIYKDLLLIGALIVILIYYFIFYIINNKEKVYLYFFILCFLSLIRVPIYGNHFFGLIFHFLNSNFILRLDYFTLYFYPIIFLKFIAELFPEKFKGAIFKKMIIFNLLFAVIMTIITIFVPVIFITSFIHFIRIVLIFSMTYIVIMVFLEFLAGKKNAGLIIFGMVLITFCLFHDVLYWRNIIWHSIGEISAIGIFFYICIQIFILAKRFSDALSDSVALNKQLKIEEELKEKIRQTEIAFLQSQIKPHFLFNALNAIDAYCEDDSKKASSLIGSLSKYLRHSFDFDNLETTVSIQREVSFINAYVDIEKSRFDYLNVEYKFDYQNIFFLPPLIIQPLVENAICHGLCKKKDGGIVKISTEDIGDEILIIVQDNGVGMSEQTLKDLLVLKNGCDNVGLININNRLNYYYNSGLVIKSELGKGTMVSFKIPKGGI